MSQHIKVFHINIFEANFVVNNLFDIRKFDQMSSFSDKINKIQTVALKHSKKCIQSSTAIFS